MKKEAGRESMGELKWRLVEAQQLADKRLKAMSDLIDIFSSPQAGTDDAKGLVVRNLARISFSMRVLGDLLRDTYGIGSAQWSAYNFAVIDLDKLVDLVPEADAEIRRQLEANSRSEKVGGGEK